MENSSIRNRVTANADLEWNVQDTVQTTVIPTCIVDWMGFFIDHDKLLDDFKLRITAYRKALFKKKFYNNTTVHRPRIFRQMILQRPNLAGRMSNK